MQGKEGLCRSCMTRGGPRPGRSPAAVGRLGSGHATGREGHSSWPPRQRSRTKMHTDDDGRPGLLTVAEVAP
ncbi:uncharacterized protein B0I36DRAFT_318229 [Microdochium trichocladiopsis]|uniref:Uncharacterized protein n=1 Tax=Microdochium trichocladiopsis TaxID=1682393 RepID=A0A9P9BT90_9PEZI|nr:uncharacterized protein B0I36DRAFT_318229 [Microdochium trichocladiopsis]KAH7035384.1 hypothetical protein B0I36DRAFT_318229 [Microdochium trichocladiopsis]